VVIPLTPEQQSLALLVAQTLSHHGLTTDILLDEQSIKGMMRKANKMGAKFCLIIGPEEQNNRQVNVKNMVTGQSTLVPQGQLINHLRS
jgi:histidyl-tRNA synthetase